MCFVVLFPMAPSPMALCSANLKKILLKPSYISTRATANYFSVKWCLIMGNQLFSAEAFLLGKVGGIPCLRALSAVCAQAMGGCWGFTDRLHWSHEPSKHKEIIHQMWSKRPAACVSTPFGILCLPKQHGLNRMGP